MKKISVLINEHKSEYENNEKLPLNFEDVDKFYSSMAEYKPTPTVSLSALAEKTGVKGIYVKDESKRFGLNAFKGLGVSYSLNCLMEREGKEKMLLVSCTDGNHGRALAWRAEKTGSECVIFMPSGSDEKRVKAIEKFGAKVIVTDKNYMDTIYEAQKYAHENGGYLVQDMSFEGYNSFVPDNIVMGYSQMIKEAVEQMSEKPTHIFIQAGVGSAAGGVAWYVYNRMKKDNIFIGVIEAENVACIYESVKENKNVVIDGITYTAMAGLNCGEANPRTLPLLKSVCGAFIKCSDDITFKGMKRSQNPLGDDEKFNGGESGAVGLGFVEEILTNNEYENEKKSMAIDKNSVILVFNTEGSVESL